MTSLVGNAEDVGLERGGVGGSETLTSRAAVFSLGCLSACVSAATLGCRSALLHAWKGGEGNDTQRAHGEKRMLPRSSLSSPLVREARSASPNSVVRV